MSDLVITRPDADVPPHVVNCKKDEHLRRPGTWKCYCGLMQYGYVRHQSNRERLRRFKQIHHGRLSGAVVSDEARETLERAFAPEHAPVLSTVLGAPAVPQSDTGD